MRVLTAGAGILLCLFGSTTAATGQDRQQASLTERDRQGVVHLFVTGADRQPILDLRPEEVSIRLGGRERPVRSLGLFMTPVPGAVPPAPEPYATNRPPAAGRDVLLIVDNESFGAGRESLVRNALAEAASLAGPGDRLGLVTVPKGLTRLAPTTDHARVKSTLAEMISRGLSTETAVDVACRTRATLDTLRQVVAGVEQERLTVIVFVSGGLTPPTAMDSIQRGTGALTTCELRTDDYTETVSTIRMSPVDFHGVFVPEDQSSGSLPSSSLVTGLEHIAGSTGNAIVRLTGTAHGVLAAVGRRVSSFYTARFDVMDDDRLGDPRRLDVKVSRAGASVSARQAIVIPKSAPMGQATRTLSPDDLLRVSTTCADVPLMAAAFPARGDDGKAVKVVTMFEPGDASQALTAAVVALYNDNGKMVARGTSPSGDLSRAPVVLGLQTKPGTYRLRVAVADARGRCGTVDQPVEAVLAKAGPLSFSSLVLGTAAGGRFSPVLEFTGAASAIAYLEVYGVSEDTLLDATYELATSADGPAVATVPVDVRTGASPGLRIVLGEILLAALPPGDIVVRAVVGVRGQQPARVSRTLRRR